MAGAIAYAQVKFAGNKFGAEHDCHAWDPWEQLVYDVSHISKFVARCRPAHFQPGPPARKS